MSDYQKRYGLYSRENEIFFNSTSSVAVPENVKLLLLTKVVSDVGKVIVSCGALSLSLLLHENVTTAITAKRIILNRQWITLSK